MSENSKIEWTDHTSKTRDSGVGMGHPVAVFAECFSIPEHQPKFGVRTERLHVMSFEVPAAIIATVNACEFVASHDVEAPFPALWRGSQILSFLRLPINVAVALRAARGRLARALAYQYSCLGPVFDARSIASPSLCRRAHLCATCFGHR